uniref:NADH-ubiquinone oxidoreductase chain 6 n=2 Tax=Tricentrus TaxID=104884 RepID=A0A343KJ80_9HEMI|nr:NADH dehydrogenase subunit 6 [Tricentrus brunneus]ATG83185.1 NADH dehydrogenase subunit 6 [Tricentrus sp. EMHAU-15062504]QEG98475.1 NADH dehydrogenase subunit 6 [Tricentrus brunneus]
MKMMLIKMMTSISIMSTMMKSPMSMGLALLIQTTLTIMMMNFNNSYSWVPMITFLTMIGGLMIIFMYMSSITSNEKFKFNTMLMIPLIFSLMITEEMSLNFTSKEIHNINDNTSNMMSMNKMYSKSMMMTMMMILYLLLTMISVNKIIKLFEGPLRSKTYE